VVVIKSLPTAAQKTNQNAATVSAPLPALVARFVATARTPALRCAIQFDFFTPCQSNALCACRQITRCCLSNCAAALAEHAFKCLT
jgi:hypothetical protein